MNFQRTCHNLKIAFKGQFPCCFFSPIFEINSFSSYCAKHIKIYLSFFSDRYGRHVKFYPAAHCGVCVCLPCLRPQLSIATADIRQVHSKQPAQSDRTLDITGESSNTFCVHILGQSALFAGQHRPNLWRDQPRL